MRSEEELRARLRAWEEASAQFSPVVRPTLDWVPSELRWVLGEEEHGALRKTIWSFLIGELHDAECTMRMEGSDLILEGTGRPPDFRHRGRGFQFLLRLKGGRFKDERTSSLPIRKIWILYRDTSDRGYVFTAQDDTLSGIIEFSADDFEFRMWDPTEGSKKGEGARPPGRA